MKRQWVKDQLTHGPVDLFYEVDGEQQSVTICWKYGLPLELNGHGLEVTDVVEGVPTTISIAWADLMYCVSAFGLKRWT